MNPKTQEEGNSHTGTAKLQSAVDAVWEKIGNLPASERIRLAQVARSIIRGESVEPISARA